MSDPGDRDRAGGLPRTGVWCATALFADRRFAEVRAFAGGLEALGYPMLWVPESFGREVLSFAALLLSCTERLVVGTGIANVWSRDPVAMANGARTLADAFPGRFVLGIGVSHPGLVARRGHDFDRPLAHMRDYLTRMDEAAWHGPSLAAEPPRLLAALGPRMLDLARERADGAHPYHVTPEHTAAARRRLGDHALLAPEQSVLVCEDPAEARARASAHLRTHLARPHYRHSFLRQGFTEADLDDGGSRRLLDGIVAWGSPAQAAARVRAHLDAGADHVAVQVVAPDPEASLVMLADLAPHLPGVARG